MAQLEVWRHFRSGEDFIVRLSDGGEVIDAAGPLYPSDRDAVTRGDFDSDPLLVEELTARGADYVLIWREGGQR